MPQPSRIITYVLLFIGGACLLSIVLFVYMILGKLGLVWTPDTCLTDALGQVSTSAGYFATSQTSCSAIAKGETDISVVASQTKQGKKTLIFKYERMHDGSRDAEPVIALVDGRTARISVKHVGSIICRNGHWDTLAVEYDIGRIVDFPGGPWPECPQD